MTEGELLRIGELSKRSGVSAELLRAWERRYGLLEPQRSSGGLRLYTPADVERVRLMREHLSAGLAAAEAAALASRTAVPGDVSGAPIHPEELRAALAEALDRFDEAGAHRILDRGLAVGTLDAFLGDVVLPYLHELGERWQRGEVSVAQEHFASAIVRGRLLGLARDWGRGRGPVAVLACLPGEQHDIGLIAFGLALRTRGWRIVNVGPDTPLHTLSDVTRELQPDIVVLTAVRAEVVASALDELEALAQRHRLALGGAAAAGTQLGERSNIQLLAGDPISEADRIATLVRAAQ